MYVKGLTEKTLNSLVYTSVDIHACLHASFASQTCGNVVNGGRGFIGNSQQTLVITGTVCPEHKNEIRHLKTCMQQ